MDASFPGLGRLGISIATDDHDAAGVTDRFFQAQKLHDRSRFCWAVVGYPSGAIARSASGRLLMRLRFDEAERYATVFNDGAGSDATRH